MQQLYQMWSFATFRSSKAKVFFCTSQAALPHATASDCTQLDTTHLTMLFGWHPLVPAALANRRSSLTDVLPRDQAARIVFPTRIGVPAARRSYCSASASPRRRNILHFHRFGPYCPCVATVRTDSHLVTKKILLHAPDCRAASCRHVPYAYSPAAAP